MELYKVTLPHGKKKFYESKKSFDQYWLGNVRYSKYGLVTAYKMDWIKQEWKCIRRVGPDDCYKVE